MKPGSLGRLPEVKPEVSEDMVTMFKLMRDSHTNPSDGEFRREGDREREREVRRV